MSYLARITTRDKGLLPLDLLSTVAQTEEQKDEAEESLQSEEFTTPIILRMINDLTNISLTEANGKLEVKSFPSYFSSNELICNTEFQENILNLSWSTYRFIMNPQLRNQSELPIKMAEKLLNIINETPLDHTYCYNLKVVSLTIGILHYLLKPRLED